MALSVQALHVGGHSPALPPGVGLLPGLSGGPVRELGCPGVSSVVKAVKGGVRSLPNMETIQEKREWKTELTTSERHDK